MRVTYEATGNSHIPLGFTPSTVSTLITKGSRIILDPSEPGDGLFVIASQPYLGTRIEANGAYEFGRTDFLRAVAMGWFEQVDTPIPVVPPTPSKFTCWQKLRL